MISRRTAINQAAILGTLASINVIIVFFYQWYVITFLGPGSDTDSLFASMVVPQLVLSVVTGSMMFVLVPILATKTDDLFKQELWNFFIATATIFTMITAILVMASNYWVPLTVPGFTKDSKNLTIVLTKIQLISMVFTALVGVMSSAYNAKQKFIWVNLSQVLSAIVGLIFLVCLLGRVGVIAAAWAMTFKIFFHMLLLLPIMGSFRKPQLTSKTFIMALAKLKPLVLGNVYTKTDLLIDRILVSMAPVGELSLLHLSQQIYGAANQVLNSSIAGPMVPLLAQKACKGDWEAFRRISKKRLYIVSAITGLILLFILFLGVPTLKYAFNYGRFTVAEITKLWWFLIALAGVLIGGAMGQILSTAFYAKGNTQTPTRIGIIGFTIGLFLKIVGFHSIGVIGVAIAASFYLLLNAFVMQYVLKINLNYAANMSKSEC